MTAAIFYVDSLGEFFERVSEAESAAASGTGLPLVHPELGGSEVYWRWVEPVAEAEEIRQRCQKETR